MRKHFVHMLCFALLAMMLWPGQASSSYKSLYVVQHDSKLRVFKIDGNQLIFQAKLEDMGDHGYGAIDLAIDDNSDTLFVSYEAESGSGGNVIELYHTVSLQHKGTVLLSGPTNLTGIVYDSGTGKLYGTERNTNELFSFDWNPFSLTLTPDVDNPFELGGVDEQGHEIDACGLTLSGTVLYVSDYYYDIQGQGTHSRRVHRYDTADEFSYIGLVDMGNDVVAIACDSTDDIIYGGAFRGDNQLIKRDLDPNSTIEKDTGANVIAVATDNSTGLVYITTYRQVDLTHTGTIEVWDTSAWTSDPNQTVSPAFTYSGVNNDGVTIEGLAGLVSGGP